jgi:hypothetical protein
VVGKSVKDRARGLHELICRDDLKVEATGHRRKRKPFGRAAGAEIGCCWRFAPKELAEYLRVSAESGGVISLRCPANTQKGGLIHELGGRDVATHAFGVVEPRLGLYGSPHTICIARSHAGSNRGDDFCVHCMREVYDTFPFRARKDAVEALRRCLERRAIVVLEVGTVPPGTAYANVGRPKRGREFAEFRVGKINWRTILKAAGIDACRLVAGARIWRSGSAFVR